MKEYCCGDQMPCNQLRIYYNSFKTSLRKSLGRQLPVMLVILYQSVLAKINASYLCSSDTSVPRFQPDVDGEG